MSIIYGNKWYFERFIIYTEVYVLVVSYFEIFDNYIDGME